MPSYAANLFTAENMDLSLEAILQTIGPITPYVIGGKPTPRSKPVKKRK
jgi:hypothetical protein